MLRRLGIKPTPQLWFAKAVVVNLVSHLPFHERIHFMLQKALGRHRLDAATMLIRSLELFRLMHHMGCEPRGKTCLEIGTGWFPFGAVVSSLLEAKSVTTVDIHPWLRLDNLRRTVLSLEPHLAQIAAATGVAEKTLAHRYAVMKQRLAAATDLGGALASLNIDYRCPLDLTRAAWTGPAIDIVISSNVLEHIPPTGLRDLHVRIASFLSPQGFCIHRFNPGDHFAAWTGSSIHFLKFSERAWKRLDGSGLAYHNRLRTPQYAELLAGTGLKLALWAESLDAKGLELLRTNRIQLHESFRGFDPESACAYYAWWVMTPGVAAATTVQPRRVQWIDEILDAKRPAVAADDVPVSRPRLRAVEVAGAVGE
jgi:hypothetical protein